MKFIHCMALASLAGSPLWLPGAGGLQASQQPRTPIDVAKLGPQAGQRVPDFNLEDQNGKPWTLKVCFNPISVPLSWMLTLRPLIAEPASRPR